MFTPHRNRQLKVGSTASLLILIAAAPLAADDIQPGIDVWTTPGGGASLQDFSGGPIPADFFDPGSDPFTGTVRLAGVPLRNLTVPSMPGTLPFDTVVERRNPASLPDVGSQDTIPIEIVALSLQSASPITVTYNGGQNPELWDVQVCLSTNAPQPLGTMTIHHTCQNGGTFDSTLPVVAKLVFVRQQDLAVRTIDPAPQLVLQNVGGRWVHNPDASLLLDRPGPGLVTDGNCDLAPDGQLPGTTANFAPGVWDLGCECQAPPPSVPQQRKRLTLEQEMLAAHGVLPPQEPPPDFDLDGIGDDADNCPTDHNPLQTDSDNDSVGDVCDNCAGISNPCQEDDNFDGIGDVCEIFSDGFESGDTLAWSITVM